MDTVSNEKRRKMMASVKQKNTKIEITLRKELRKKGIKGYRVHVDLPGTPDVVFSRNKLAVFVDGCFWHGCPIDFRPPSTNVVFWEGKIKKNIERDKEVNERLKRQGWTVLRFWGHEIKKTIDDVVEVIANEIS